MMKATEILRPYRKLRLLAEAFDATMTWEPMGSGGDWVLKRRDVPAKRVKCRNHEVNELGNLYEPRAGVTTPKTWDDYDGDDSPLKPNASELFLAFFER